ncbi:MAG: transposase [Gammaproteobacteria bacterium]|nr:transposase [Gammaproteobacteria bacterium]
MPRSRKTLVSLDATPYYHCTTRCVRRAFLCGEDKFTGKSFEHRRKWIEERLLQLGGIYAIDVCAYAVMSNHYHVVLHINRDQALGWSVNEVIDRWHQLFKGNLLSQRYCQGEPLSKAEQTALNECVEEWRNRLMDISWFMRCANEFIARSANREDQVTGRFWESRFSSQALLDEKALMAGMVYVELNPIRAKMAETPEQSDYTSIKRRITQALKVNNPEAIGQQPETLFPFAGYPGADMPEGIPFSLSDYLELVDWTGRIIREDKRGYIPEQVPPILQRLTIDTRHWLYLTRHFELPFKNLVGAAFRVRKVCEQAGQHWAQGIKQCERLFSSS